MSIRLFMYVTCRHEAALVRRIHIKARVIQKAFRTYCRVMYSAARWQKGLVRRLLRFKAATMINSYARMRFGRR